MRLLLVLFFLLSCVHLFGQPKVRHMDRFRFTETGYDKYESVYSRFQEEGVKGNVKEFKKRSSGVSMHVKLNREGKMFENIHYSPNGGISEVSSYRNEKITETIAFNPDGTKDYISYEYNKSGSLISVNYRTGQRNKKPSSVIAYSYNGEGQLVLRKYKQSELQFLYEGDSIEWRVRTDYGKLQYAARLLRRNRFELVTIFKIDTLSSGEWKDAISPDREYETRWNTNGDIVEAGEFEYDSMGKRRVREFKMYTYNSDNFVAKVFAVYDTPLLKTESVREYTYTGKGLLKMEVARHGSRIDEMVYQYDDHGNFTSRGKFVFRYLYDTYGNWTTRQMLYKAGSSYRSTIGGITTGQTFDEDTWITEEVREISYY